MITSTDTEIKQCNICNVLNIFRPLSISKTNRASYKNAVHNDDDDDEDNDDDDDDRPVGLGKRVVFHTLTVSVMASHSRDCHRLCTSTKYKW